MHILSFRLRSLVLVTLTLILAGSNCFAEEHFKVGVIIPLTGGAASWGKHMSQAARMALEDSSTGDAPIELIFEDDQLKGALGVSSYRKLVAVDKVDSLIVFGGQSVAAIAPLSESQQITSFMITANDSLTAGKKYSFLHWMGSRKQIAHLVPYFREHGMKRVASLVTSHEAMNDYASRLVEAVKADGGEIVFRDEAAPGDLDFKGIVQKLRGSTPDCVVLGLLPPQLSAFMKDLTRAHARIPVFGYSNTEAETEVTAAGGAMEGVVYTAPTLSKAFIARYRAKFGSEYPELAAGNMYDIVTLIIAAVRAGVQDSKGLRQHVIDFPAVDGVLGNYTLSSSQVFDLEAQLKIIRDGKFAVLSDVAEEKAAVPAE